MILEFKFGQNGASGLYQVNGRGPWRNEYKTDSIVSYLAGNGIYPVMCEGRQVGFWVQQNFGHVLKAV